MWKTCACLVMLLVLTGIAAEQVISDFETLEGWRGLVPDREVVREGTQSGLWADAVAVNSVSLEGPLDFSGYRGMRLWIHSSAANGQRIDLLAFSRTLALDYFQWRFTLDWTGWRELVVPFYAFWPVRSPAGWDKIDRFTISASWDDTPREDTVLRLDSFRLTNDVPPEYRDLLTNRELIEALDLDRPGLEEVRARAEAEQWDEAAGALLAFYEGLTEARHMTDPAQPQPPPNPDYNTARADRVLNHEFSFYHSDYYHLGETIDWTANPVNDREWPTALNRHGDLATLTRAWWHTGDDRYAEGAASFLRQWIAAARVTSVKRADVYWSTLNTAIRLTVWPEAWTRLLKAEAFDAEIRLQMLKMFYHQAEYLTEHHGGGNWLVTESRALLGVALLLPEFTRAAVWEQTALGRLGREIETQTYPEGAQYELTPHYHLVCIGGFVTPVHLMRRNGRDMPPEYLERLEKMYEYLMYVSKPDRHIPMLNDSDHNNIQRLMADGAALFGREDMRYIATDGAKGDEPAPASLAMTFAGQYVMRSDWSSDALYLIFDAGPYGIGHQHEDKLNVDIHAYGSDLILDPGRFTYGDPKWRSFFLETVGHNLILVDGAGQNRRRSPRETWVATAPMPVTWASCDAFDYARGDYDEGFGRDGAGRVTHTRAVWFVKPAFWVVADFLRPDADTEHEYQALWHFGRGEARADGHTVVFSGETAGMRVTPALPESAQVEITEGREDPPQGWISYWYGEKHPAPTAVYTFAGGAVDLPTVLYPFPGRDDPEPAVGPLEVEGGTGVRVSTPAGAHAVVFAAPGAATVRWNGYESDAEAFALAFGPEGGVTAAHMAAGTFLRGPGGLSIEHEQPVETAEWRPN